MKSLKLNACLLSELFFRILTIKRIIKTPKNRQEGMKSFKIVYIF